MAQVLSTNTPPRLVLVNKDAIIGDAAPHNWMV